MFYLENHQEQPETNQSSPKEIYYLVKDNLNLRKKLNEFLQKQQSIQSIQLELKDLIKANQRTVEQKVKFKDLSQKSSESLHQSINEAYGRMYDILTLLRNKVDELLSIKQETLLSAFNEKIAEVTRSYEESMEEKEKRIQEIVQNESEVQKKLRKTQKSIEFIEKTNAQIEQEKKTLQETLVSKELEIQRLNSLVYKLKKDNPKCSLSAVNSNSSLHEKINLETHGSEPSKADSLKTKLRIEQQNLKLTRKAYFREKTKRAELYRAVESCLEEFRSCYSREKLSMTFSFSKKFIYRMITAFISLEKAVAKKDSKVLFKTIN